MTQEGLSGRDLRNAILFGAVVYLGIRFIADIADIILIFSVTGLFVMVLDSPVSWLARHKVPRQISAAVIGLVVIGLVVLALYLIIPPASRQVQELWKQGPQLADGLKKWLQGFADAHPTIAGLIPRDISIDGQSIRQITPSLLGGASRLTASAAGTIISIFLVFISTIYTLANPRPLSEGFLNVVGPAYRNRFEAAGERLQAQMKAWAGGIAAAMVIIFALTWVLLAAIGLKQAFLFAVVAGLLEAVPIIGPVLSAVPPVLVTLMSGNPILALWIIVLFIAIQQVENHLLVPMIMSRQLSLHPVTVIFSVLVMGGLFGIVGVFLASPAAAALGVLFDELYARRSEVA